jgi:hypothetical protein
LNFSGAAPARAAFNSKNRSAGDKESESIESGAQSPIKARNHIKRA